MSSNPINLHLWESKPVSLFTVEIKQYNIRKGFCSFLRGEPLRVGVRSNNPYLDKLQAFLEEKVKQYGADVFEVSLIPSMGTGVWMDDVTQDTYECEVVTVKFHSLHSPNHSNASKGMAMYFDPPYFEDATDLLRTHGWSYNEETDTWTQGDSDVTSTQ